MLTTHPFSPDFPAVKPSAIALGTIFNHATELAVMTPLFGQTYKRAKASHSKEEFLKSQEATSTAVAWGSALVGSALQSYGVGALINATGTLSYKGAAYLGALIFAATSAPGVSSRPPSSRIHQIVIRRTRANMTHPSVHQLPVCRQANTRDNWCRCPGKAS